MPNTESQLDPATQYYGVKRLTAMTDELFESVGQLEMARGKHNAKTDQTKRARTELLK